jgi:hypothetical protein
MVSRRTSKLPGSRPILLVYALDGTDRAAAEATSFELELSRIEARDLRVACKALTHDRPVFVVGASHVKPWDRQVLHEHAARTAAPVRWIAPREWHLVEPALRDWVREAVRPKRT